MPVQVRCYTDPACPWSWGAEPQLRRLAWEFEDELEFRWIMGGLARSLGDEYADSEGGIGAGADCFSDLIAKWLDVSDETGMPSDPRIWSKNPMSSTYPVCMAVKAAAEQGAEAAGRYLRRAREAIMTERVRLDHSEALAMAAEQAGLDVERFRLDLSSNAITEAFAADLDEARAIPAEAREQGKVATTEGRERVTFPSLRFGEAEAVWGPAGYEVYREAAIRAGARVVNDGPLEPLDAVRRFGRVATREAEELAQRPRPLVEKELWSLAAGWKLKPFPVLTGTLWAKA